MRNCILFQKYFLLVSTILLVLQECNSEFTCKDKPGDKMPKFPDVYSLEARLNFLDRGKSVDIKQVVKDKKISLEFFDGLRHVKYIRNGDQQILLSYGKDDMYPTCSVKTLKQPGILFQDEDAGQDRILEKLHNTVHGDTRTEFINTANKPENGITVRRWERCRDEIKAAFSFASITWDNSYVSVLHDDEYVVSAEAETENEILVALVSNFNPKAPSDMEFMPPENVYCEGFIPKTNKKPPTILDYFSYDSELVMYKNAEGIDPISMHRSVYYDLPASIVRTDFYDAYQDDPDMFSEVTARSVSIIHDFNSGVQYKINPTTGACEIDTFLVTTGPIALKLTGKDKMSSGKEFFDLNIDNIQYNGVFNTRGYEVDVYTAPIDIEKEKFILSWYFSSEGTQVVEKEEVVKNVLVRMVIRRAAVGEDKAGMVIVNLYNFEKGEPGDFVYDLTTCYNESLTKHYVLTFPAKVALKGSERKLSALIHQSIQSVTGVSSQRVFMSEVTFKGMYMYARFKLLAAPNTVYANAKATSESTLEEAVAKLEKSIADNIFNASIEIEGKMEYLKPVTNGLNEFAGDLKIDLSKGSTYKEGSVIALTIGMLFLGFVLGAVTINLIVSKKFGVSLCQRSKVTHDPFSNSLGESSM